MNLVWKACIEVRIFSMEFSLKGHQRRNECRTTTIYTKMEITCQKSEISLISLLFFICSGTFICRYWFDRKSAQEVDQRIQKGLFLFACTNSCVNPLIYGLFHFRPRKNSSSTNVQRSFPNGYRRPPVPRYDYVCITSRQEADVLIYPQNNPLQQQRRSSSKFKSWMQSSCWVLKWKFTYCFL